MKQTNLTCIECPIGCDITVTTDGDKVVEVRGNGCPRGKAYASAEVVCPMRVLTTTVKSKDGRMVSVKTSKPVKKSEIFTLMEKFFTVKVDLPIKIGDVIEKNVSDGADLIATVDLA